jgi:hypothetical protein
MTAVLRRSGVIDGTDEVVAQEESDVGMSAGYFSSIKKVKCTYNRSLDAPDCFVVKSWPTFEILPKESLEIIFVRDINAYAFPAARFFPRPRAYLAAFDRANDGWVLVLEDADTFAEHKVHEQEMALDEVERMIPGLVDVAVAWEGCDEGDKARELAEIGVDRWVSDTNLGVFKTVMPSGAKLFDKLTMLDGSSLVGDRPWPSYAGGSGIAEMLTTRLDAFFEPADPRQGATCTLCHGDMKGDNIFFCEPSDRYPFGWLCIDFQLMFRGPVPSDLAYLLTSGTVLPDVYSGPNLHRVLRLFYDQFVAKSQRYRQYRYDSFMNEFVAMATLMFLYYVGLAAPIWREGAWANARGARIELGGQGATEADLPPEELRQRMWWRKTIANFRSVFSELGLYERLQRLPEDRRGLGEWTELPDHLR